MPSETPEVTSAAPAPVAAGGVDLSDMPEGLTKMEQMKVCSLCTAAIAIDSDCADHMGCLLAVEARGEVESRGCSLEAYRDVAA